MEKADYGVIGGTGIYEIDGLERVEELGLDTPFGKPSDRFVIGELAGRRIAFLARHGQGHRLIPSEVPVRANIYGFKALGVKRLISASAVGSMREDIGPMDFVVPDQYFDRTKCRPSTFFQRDIAVHISFDEPVCPELSDVVYEAAVDQRARVHRGGTYLVIEGPAFSTKAESEIYRQWGVDIIGMTALPEAKLAREAEICYCTLALVSDFDTWHESETTVSVDVAMENLSRSRALAQRIIRSALLKLTEERECGCAHALENAMTTSPEALPAEEQRRMWVLLGKYISGNSQPVPRDEGE